MFQVVTGLRVVSGPTKRVGAWRVCLCQQPDRDSRKFPLSHRPDNNQTQRTPRSVDTFEMSGHEEYDDAANAEDVGQTGPGAPTPLQALEVSSGCGARRILDKT